MSMIRRFTWKVMNALPQPVLNFLWAAYLNRLLDHEMYSLKPDYPPLAQHPMVNDELGNRIACGSVKIKTDVKRFTANGVEFIDGTTEDNIDVVSDKIVYGYCFNYIHYLFHKYNL